MSGDCHALRARNDGGSLRGAKKQTSLRGAKRRGNLYQVVAVQNEAARQRREIATPFGLAMTVVHWSNPLLSNQVRFRDPEPLQFRDNRIVLEHIGDRTNSYPEQLR